MNIGRPASEPADRDVRSHRRKAALDQDALAAALHHGAHAA
jgi:hypothetical protein